MRTVSATVRSFIRFATRREVTIIIVVLRIALYADDSPCHAVFFLLLFYGGFFSSILRRFFHHVLRPPSSGTPRPRRRSKGEWRAIPAGGNRSCLSGSSLAPPHVKKKATIVSTRDPRELTKSTKTRKPGTPAESKLKSVPK